MSAPHPPALSVGFWEESRALAAVAGALVGGALGAATGAIIGANTAPAERARCARFAYDRYGDRYCVRYVRY